MTKIKNLINSFDEHGICSWHNSDIAENELKIFVLQGQLDLLKNLTGNKKAAEIAKLEKQIEQLKNKQWS